MGEWNEQTPPVETNIGAKKRVNNKQVSGNVRDAPTPTYLIVDHKAAPVWSPADNVILAVGLELTQHVVELHGEIAVSGMGGFTVCVLQVARVEFVRVVYISVLHFTTPGVTGSLYSNC